MSGAHYSGQQIEIEAFVETAPSRLYLSALSTSTSIVVYDASRWSPGDILKVGDGDPQIGPSRLVTIAGGGITGLTVTLTAALGVAWAAGTPVYKLAAATMACSTQVEPAGTADTSTTLSSVSTGRYRGTKTLVDADAGEMSIEVNATGAVVASGAIAITVRSPLV